jgi:hypothetical protein
VPLVAVDSMIIDLLDENLYVEDDIAEAIEALEPPLINLSPAAYAVYWLVALAHSGEAVSIRSRIFFITNCLGCLRLNGGTRSGYCQ